MIGKGERLILTGYNDVLHIRLEPFVVDGYQPTQYIERRVTWELLAAAVIDVLPQTIGAMREGLNRCPQCGNPITTHKLDCGWRDTPRGTEP